MTFQVDFTFVPTTAHGNVTTRTMHVKAKTAAEAENRAWAQRFSYWGAFGTENAIDCVARPAALAKKEG